MISGEKRRLGKTSIEITSIGLGAMQFSGGKGIFRYFLPVVPPNTIKEIVKVAIESGMNWVDTAEIYGSGTSEKNVSISLKAAGKSPGEIVIATKWFPLLKRAKTISKSASNSIKNLYPFQIDLYLVHQPYSLSSTEVQMDAMADLVESDKIRAVGVSNFSAEKMIAAHESLSERGVPLAANQMRFSLLDRRIESDGVLDTAKDLGVTIIAYTPLEQGILAGKFYRNPESLNDLQLIRKMMIKKRLKKSQLLVEILESIGHEHKATAAQVSLSWITNFHGDVVVAIPGSTKTIQAEQNAKAMNLRLSSEEMKTIDEVSLNI